MSYWVIFIVFMVLSQIVGSTLHSKFKKYSKMPLRSGLTGREIAEKMLQDHGITDVRVVSTPGFLTDHYNPTNKTLNLSNPVYNSASVSAAAVAAHECGHAIQHATAYRWLTMRSAMVPIVQFGSRWAQWVLLAGLVLYTLSAWASWLLLLGIALFALTTLFSFITLPVEYNASSRALAWLNNTGLTTGIESTHAQDALRWAARTYLVAALSSLATLLYYISIFLRRS